MRPVHLSIYLSIYLSILLRFEGEENFVFFFFCRYFRKEIVCEAARARSEEGRGDRSRYLAGLLRLSPALQNDHQAQAPLQQVWIVFFPSSE